MAQKRKRSSDVGSGQLLAAGGSDPAPNAERLASLIGHALGELKAVYRHLRSNLYRIERRLLGERRYGRARQQRSRPQLDRWLVGIGAICLVGAIVAGGIKAFGVELPVVSSLPRQLLLAGLGVVLIGTSYFVWTAEQKPAKPTSEHSSWPASTVPIAGAVPRATPYFIGRGQLLQELSKALFHNGLAVLTGLGGVGKTQAAIAYVRLYRQEYDTIWWVRAAQATILAEDYAALADLHRLCEGTDALNVKVAAVRRWLENTDRWLLVFDDADDEIELDPYLPSRQTGHVIVSSRDRLWHEAATLEVHPWSRGESVTFLRAHTENNEEAIIGIAQELGDLPLALEQARAYLHETKRSVPAYLAELQAHADELMAHGTPARYEYTVATTWSVSLERVRHQAPAAEQLLALWAFLAPEDLPRNFLGHHANELPRPLREVVADSVEYDHTLSIISRYSLVEMTEDALSVHRLVQAVVRGHLNRREGYRWTAAAVRLVAAAFPDASPETWPVCGRLLPHALAAINHAERLNIEHETVAALLTKVACYLQERVELEPAKELLARALAVREVRLGPEHLEVAESLDLLGTVLRDLGEPLTARPVLERAVAIRRAQLGEDHPAVAASLKGVAAAMLDAGTDLPAARAVLDRALAIDEARLGADDPQVAWSLNVLGLILRRLGDLSAARTVLERALAIAEAQLGPGHRQVAWTLNNLGFVLRNLGELPAARAAHERALAISKSQLGADHPEVAWSLDHLGNVFRALGEHAQAKVAFERALSIREDRLGARHPDVARGLTGLGLVLRDLGELPAARAAHERAVAINEMRLGADHPEVAWSLDHLGNVLLAMGDHAEAKVAFERAGSVRNAASEPATRMAWE